MDVYACLWFLYIYKKYIIVTNGKVNYFAQQGRSHVLTWGKQ